MQQYQKVPLHFYYSEKQNLTVGKKTFFPPKKLWSDIFSSWKVSLSFLGLIEKNCETTYQEIFIIFKVQIQKYGEITSLIFFNFLCSPSLIW